MDSNEYRNLETVMKILIVDDAPLNVILLSEMLSDQHEIHTAHGGKEALKKVADTRLDIILLDIMMPQVDGYEVLQRIKANPTTEGIPVIMITAKTEKEDLKKALELGASDYLKKPVDSIELLTKLAFFEKVIQNNKRIEEYQVYANINDSMLMAQRFQTCLAPDKLSFRRIFPKSFVFFAPRDFVSGDLYYVFENGNKKFIALFDCVGHGVPAAMMSIFVYTALNFIVGRKKQTDPVVVAKELHDEAISNLHKSGDMYSAFTSLEAVFCEINTTEHEISFFGAARPLFLIRNNDELLYVNNELNNCYNLTEDNLYSYVVDGYPVTIGAEDQNIIQPVKKIKTEKNDRIYFFSDGFTDQFGKNGSQKYSKRLLYNLFLNTQTIDIKDQKSILYSELKNWMGEVRQTDDILIIGIEL